MHTFCSTSILCFLVVSYPAYGDLLISESEDRRIESRTIFDDDLREFVEFLRLQMPCGYAPAGIPPLVPLHTSYRELMWVTETADIRGNVTKLTITGLNEFDVRQLHFHNIFRKIKYDVNFPEILITGNYKADILTKIRQTALHIFGDGELHLTLKNLRINGSFVIGPKLSGSVKLSKFKATTELGDVESKLTGLMHSKLKTKLINKWIEEFIDLTFNDSQEDVSAALERWIVPSANQAFDKIPALAVLALIFGIIDGELPQETLC